VPTKRIPDVVRYVFDDFEKNGLEGEYYNDYFLRLGEKHFYALLKPLADLKTLTQEEYFDWGQDRMYKQEIGVGECAAVILDMVGVILKDAMDKIVAARETLAQGEWSDAIYSSYAAFVIAAKAMLLSKDIKCNTQKGVIDDFQTHFVESGEYTEVGNFTELVLQINQYEPEENFATDYFAQAESFVRSVINIREAKLVESNGIDKKVVGDYYRA
jgi:sulfite reductase (ferredoxin)